jgi:hypothetical protein
MQIVRRLLVVLVGTAASVFGAAAAAHAVLPHVVANHSEPLVRRSS